MNKFVMALGAAAVLFSSSAFAADVANGEKIVKTRCAACHTFENGAANKVGPNLFGVTVRGPGKAAGFAYSAGMVTAAGKGFAWDEPTLKSYLNDPSVFLRQKTGDEAARSKMTFKLTAEAEQADVAAYLLTLK